MRCTVVRQKKNQDVPALEALENAPRVTKLEGELAVGITMVVAQIQTASPRKESARDRDNGLDLAHANYQEEPWRGRKESPAARSAR